MNVSFRLNRLQLAICLAFPLASLGVHADEPFPSLPPSLSTSVTPNIMLYIDTSGSMLQDQNNQWMQTGLCNSNTTAWNSCVDNNTWGYRTAIDSETTTPNTKMNIAKRVARNLVNNNRSLRFGLFSFRDNPNNIGGDERTQAAVLRSKIRDVSSDSERDALFTAINGIYGRTGTPLGEGLLEVTRYFSGQKSLYGLNSGNAYTSPIQYRCQKNFVIVITDGDATGDQNLPGTGYLGEDDNPKISKITYTARDKAGNAVSKDFTVCGASNSNTDDGYGVTCPATYDSDGTTRTFVNGENYPSALRDVAMYANRADLKIGGSDGDGKSYDDPKFSLQNLITYTVGFAVANSVLPSAAKVGGGKSYTATDETSLSNALNSAVSSIASSVSNAGGVVTVMPYKKDGNKIFQPVFDPKDWHGELRCYDYASIAFDSNGNVVSGACSVPKAVIPTEANRKIYTSSWDSTANKFDFSTSSLSLMSAVQKTSLGATSTDQQNTIKFLRGQSVSGMRTRASLLGDIVDAQPVVVSEPGGSTSDADYAKFKSDNATRNIVFIGANDGMMHAFGVSDMSELMGYVPAAVYPRLDELTKTDYGTSTQHVYHVNGEVRQSDVKLPLASDPSKSAWNTLLVGGLAQGGQGYYALNATSSSTLTASAASAVKWEWNDQKDSDMGYTFGAPLIYNVRASGSTVVPAVIFANGYENDFDDTASGGKRKAEVPTDCQRTTGGVTKACNTGALYIVNANTGALIKKISVPARSDGVGGLSSPAGVDFGQDGILDYVYAGDLAGRMWRFDLTAAESTSWGVSSNPIFDAGVDQPITLRPAIRPVSTSAGVSRGNLILFGTGKLLTNADRNTTATQSFYAVLDDMSANPLTISKSSLLPRQIDTDEYAYSGTNIYPGTYRRIVPLSDSSTFNLASATETYKGWYMDLPASSERLVSSPILLDYMLLFGTGIPLSTEKCLAGGKGWVMGVDPMTGGVTVTRTKKEYSFIDVYLDGKSTDKDKVPFSAKTSYASGFAMDAIPTELTYVSNNSKVVSPDAESSGAYGKAGGAIALFDANAMSVYSGNAASGTSRGSGQGRVGGDGSSGGSLVTGEFGNESFNKRDTLPPPGDGYTVQTTIWRELTN